MLWISIISMINWMAYILALILNLPILALIGPVSTPILYLLSSDRDLAEWGFKAKRFALYGSVPAILCFVASPFVFGWGVFFIIMAISVPLTVLSAWMANKKAVRFSENNPEEFQALLKENLK